MSYDRCEGVGIPMGELNPLTPLLSERFEMPTFFRAERIPETMYCGQCKSVRPTRTNQTQVRCAACGAFSGLIVRSK